MPKPVAYLFTHLASTRVRLSVTDASPEAREAALSAAEGLALAPDPPWSVEREGEGLTIRVGSGMHVGGGALVARLGYLRSDVRRAATLALRAAGYTIRRG